ncbi:hypothetical protein APY04_3022 [Hyphomicrobium sulfonivorans]|uniref:Uncharacterized protein n=1 Tax=Hyphomicrobium sulfonivorans TaxID=121290 RepID=A0A109BAP7_HYPSL|nr:hypothetical protein APY04_3022 [Hyphomicrobium sulfonivorans]NSL70226.1 hypothetical protein [Hyphomicrobium sulfonivorans]
MRNTDKTLTPTEASQGSPRRLNLRVLVQSLLLAVVAAAGLYTIFYAGNTSMSTPDPAPLNETAPGP